MSSPDQERSVLGDFPIVGIGASAGGIEALRSLFKAIPAKPNLAFVVVQHLNPDQPSQLASLFRNWTGLTVREASDGMALEPNCVFIAPPGSALAFEAGVFTTRPLDRAGSRAGIDTIDTFLESLAKDAGSRAIAVILSGTGADGAAGAVRVKQAGGMVLVQEPATAMHDSMPVAAIANGAADHVMPLGSLAQELLASALPGYVHSETAQSWIGTATKALDGIMDLIRTRAGFDLTGYKTPPLLWCIQRRMELRRVQLFVDYEALLHDDPAELEALVRSIPIHVTEFFRNPAVWEALRRDVIPQIFDVAGEAPIRAWTPACATGEEAYSVAMLLAEHADTTKPPAHFQVFATDSVSEIVARAGRGIFKPAALNTLSAERRQRFFYAADGGFRVKRSLREKMVFAPQDLLADPPFTDLDLITCRNLMIYLEPEMIRRVIYLLHSALRMGGYLLLGKGESLSPRQEGFEEVASGTRIYRKTGPASKTDIAFPKRPIRLSAAGSTLSTLEACAHEMAVERLELPAVLIDRGFQIVRLYGDTTPFLHLKSGEPTLNLLRLLAPAATPPLEAAAREVLATGQAVTVDDLSHPRTGHLTSSLRITRLDTPNGGDPRLLVSFISPGSGGVGGGTQPVDNMDWSEALRLSHEELESSREELQALNEELRASNEQLNIANDDLESANAELKGKVRELETQSNVLSSGEVATLFLDELLRVRWFTPAVSRLFPLKPTDVGRSIEDLVPRFEYPPFIPDVRRVMNTGELCEAEIQTTSGRWYGARILPFRTDNSTGASAGVAVTFNDISERKLVEAVRRTGEERYRTLFEASPAPLLIIKPDAPGFTITEVNDAYLAATHRAREEVVGRGLFEAYPDSSDAATNGGVNTLIASLERVIASKQSDTLSDLRYELARPDGTFEERWWRPVNTPMLDENGAVETIIQSINDVTEQHRAEAALRQGEVVSLQPRHRRRQ